MPSRNRLGEYFTRRAQKGRASLPLFSVTMNNGLVHRDTLERKMNTNLAPEEHLLIKKGDIAYNMMRMWQGASGLAHGDGIVSPAYVVLAPKDGIDPVFASHWFKSSRMIYLFWAYSYGLTGDRLRLYFKDFARVPATPPPLAQQRQIAAMLRTWDTAIERTEKLIEAKRRLKQGLMQQLLTGKRRFPGFAATKRVKETKYGRIPTDWDLSHFREVADINQQSLPETTDPDYKFFYVDLSAVREGVIDIPLLKVRFEDSPSRARRVAKQGDLMMATVRPNLRGFALPAFDTTNFVFSTGFAIISPKCADDSQFLYHSLYSEMIARQLYGLTVGSSYPAITGKEVKQLKLAYPSNPEERFKIGAVLDSQDREIQQLCRLVDQFRYQKRGLMQKLLTGKVRVKV